GVLESLRVGVTRVFQMTAMLLTSLWMVVCGAIPAKESLAGPIGIFYMTSEAASRGLLTLLNFMGALSVSLFVLNLLPVPVLDGGHLLFLMIEKIKGSPLSDRFKERTTQVGMVLLLALMVFLVAQDLKRFAFFGSRAPVSVAATNQGS
ncbi:MAG: site-2 protease family protein, partial [Candidatus Omnitrophota bacterium]